MTNDQAGGDRPSGPLPDPRYLRELESEDQEAVMHEAENHELARREDIEKRRRRAALDALADAADWQNAPREERWGP